MYINNISKIPPNLIYLVSFSCEYKFLSNNINILIMLSYL